MGTSFSSIRTDIRVFKRASEVAEQLLKDAQKDDMSPRDRDLSMALAAYELRHYQESIDLLLTLYSNNPEGEIAIRISVCYWRLGEIENMADWANKAVSLNPTGCFRALIDQIDVPYLSILSLSMFSQGRLEASAATSSESLSIFPKDSMLLEVAAKSYAALGQLDEAISLADRLPSKNRELVESLQNLRSSGLGSMPIALSIGVNAVEAVA